MKSLGLLTLLFFSFSCMGMGGRPPESHFLTRAKVKKIIEQRGSVDLIPGTYKGCVLIPSSVIPFKNEKDRNIRALFDPGHVSTGETCSVTIHKNKRVSISFIPQKNISVFPVSGSDVFVAELSNGDVLMVQEVYKKVVDVNQTIYDAKGKVVYGSQGEGDWKKSCHINYGQGAPCERSKHLP